MGVSSTSKALLFSGKHIRAAWRELVWENLRSSRFSDSESCGGGTSWFDIVDYYPFLLASGILPLVVSVVTDLGMEVRVFELPALFVL